MSIKIKYSKIRDRFSEEDNVSQRFALLESPSKSVPI